MKYLLGFVSLVFVFSCSQQSATVTSNVISADGVNYDSLRTVLEEIYEVDRAYRDQRARTSEPNPELEEAIKKADAAHLVEVKKILEEYGWLSKNKVGIKAADALFLIVQRADLATMEKYFPELKSMAESGDATKRNAAILEDRILVRKKQKQLYGSQARARTSYNGEKEYFIWPVQDAADVNKRRAEMGFRLTIEENAHRLNAVYDPQEELPGVK